MSETPPPRERLRPLPAGVLAGAFVVTLVLGWLTRRLTEAWFDHAPVITWGQPVLLLVIAFILGYVAWSTYRTVQVQHVRLDPARAVNRLVLARACAIVGALAAGFYLGYALSWLGVDSDLAHQRLIRSALAGLAGGGMVAGGLVLEWACRVKDDESST